MAITKVGAMTDPPVAGDYAILQAKLDAYAKQVGNQGMILTQWTNTTTAPKIAMGSYITHGGTLFVVDTEDFAVSAPAGDGTYYLKVAVSGDTLVLSWVASTSGYSWNAIYNGLYHSDESQILPYQLVKAGANLTKRKITNLMQGSGFVTVDWTGHTNYVNQGVKTTDSPTFAKITVTGAEGYRTAGDYTIYAGLENHIVTTTIYTKASKEIKVKKQGVIRVRFGISVFNTSSTVTGVIYKNGSAIGTERSTSSKTTVYFTEDLAVVSGDIFVIYIKSSDSNTVYCSSIEIQCNEEGVK